MPRASLGFDCVVAADFREGDTGAKTALGYVRALAEAGYSVAILQIYGGVGSVRMAFDPGFSAVTSKRNVTWIARDVACHAKLFLVIDFRLFRYRVRQATRITAKRSCIVVTRGLAGQLLHARTCLENAREYLGTDAMLLPGAPTVRASLNAALPFANLSAEDCPPAVHLDRGQDTERVRRITMPALGYYRASSARPWPSEAAHLRQILPPHPLIELKLLMAPRSAEEALSEHPAQVQFWSDPSKTETFLGEIDLLASSDNATDDPYPPEVLAGLAAGAIPLLSPDYRGIFLSSAVYLGAEPLADRIVDLFGTPGMLEDYREAGREVLAGIFAPEQFIKQVSRWIGAPGTPSVFTTGIIRPKRRILSLSTNGIGLGHLSRQLAVAERLRPDVDTVFIGFSQAIATVRKFGYISEHIPYFSSIGLDPGYWNRAVAEHLNSAVAFYRPSALMVDANHPFEALRSVRARHPGLPMIWMRRAMWRNSHDLTPFERSHLFDMILEPGEIAQAYDDGPTVGRPETTYLQPVRLVDRGMQFNREAACREIGLSPDALNVLLMPGAQNNFDADGLWTEILRELSGWSNTMPVLCEWAISEAEHPWPASYPRLRGFPYPRWFRAFDFAVSTAGYNSFADLVALGVPSVFVPNDNPSMDRQDLRALFAERRGMGALLRSDATGSVTACLAPFRDAEFRRAMSRKQMAVVSGNGAYEAANLIRGLVHGTHAHRPDVWIS